MNWKIMFRTNFQLSPFSVFFMVKNTILNYSLAINILRIFLKVGKLNKESVYSILEYTATEGNVYKKVLY